MLPRGVLFGFGIDRITAAWRASHAGALNDKSLGRDVRLSLGDEFCLLESVSIKTGIYRKALNVNGP